MAANHHWNSLWLESDSALVVNALKIQSLVPWRLRNRWNNCMHIVSIMNFWVSHVYREGNCCVGALANIDLTIDNLTILLEIPACIIGFYIQNMLGLCSCNVYNIRNYGLLLYWSCLEKAPNSGIYSLRWAPVFVT